MPDTDAKYDSLRNRSVVVTGGATGIGEAIVRGFAVQGAKVAFLDIEDAAGTALAGELGGAVRFYPCDLKDVDALNRAMAEIAENQGPPLGLVNNAANDTRHDWQQVTPDYFDDRVAVNLRHVFFAIRAVAPGMIAAGGGSIVNFGSISWMMAGRSYPIYGACKAAIHGLTRTMARELGEHNIRVNTVVPGWVMTQRQLDLWVDEAGARQIDESQCLAGRVMPADLADMVMFLCSDSSRMCSAQNYVVDGGWV